MISRRVKMTRDMNLESLDSGMMFCLLDAPDRYAIEKHHYKFRMKCDWITPIKMISEAGE